MSPERAAEVEAMEAELKPRLDAIIERANSEGRVFQGCQVAWISYTPRGRAFIEKCGDTHAGERIMCDAHEADAKARFPQGWRYYPGDVCKHGRYVGGSGADYLCGDCEMGN